MDTDRMRLFVEVVERGTLSAAAKAVHLSQPAATRNLQALENELGVELFDRRGRRLHLSAAGRALLPRARLVLDAMDAARAAAARAQERGYHDVRIGTVDSIGTYVMPAVLPALRDSFDSLGVKLVTSRTASLLERLHDDIDIAVVAWSGPPPTQNATRVAPYQLQFYGHAEHFASLRSVEREEDLLQYAIVQIEPRPGQPTMVRDDAASYALTQSLASVKTLILSGFGIGALLDYMITPAERQLLVSAAIPHDPACALWVVRSPDFVGDRARQIEARVVELVREALVRD